MADFGDITVGDWVVINLGPSMRRFWWRVFWMGAPGILRLPDPVLYRRIVGRIYWKRKLKPDDWPDGWLNVTSIGPGSITVDFDPRKDEEMETG